MTAAYAWGLTVSAGSGGDQILEARRLAERWGAPFIPRENSSLRELKAARGLDFLVTMDRDGRVFSEEPFFHWHPSMAVPRFRRLAEGGEDTFLAAAALQEGDRFLDCTLGMGADALIAAWAVGDRGVVVALEASPVVALISGWGLEHEAPKFERRKAPMTAASRRIDVRCEEALSYLQACAPESWDVIYFDPMFRAPNEKSSGLNSLRPLAYYGVFDAVLLAEALRVCRKRVLLKERWFSPLYRELGADRTFKTKYSPVAFGIWEKKANG